MGLCAMRCREISLRRFCFFGRESPRGRDVFAPFPWADLAETGKTHKEEKI